MKGYLLSLLLLSTTLFSGYIFSHEVKKDTGNTSLFYKSLEGVKPYLVKVGRLSVQTSEPKVQHVLEARYILFPVQLHLSQAENADTTLYILTKEDGSITVKGQVLWENTDDRFHYCLVKKR